MTYMAQPFGWLFSRLCEINSAHFLGRILLWERDLLVRPHITMQSGALGPDSLGSEA